jgi:hypothetical protein
MHITGCKIRMIVAKDGLKYRRTLKIKKHFLFGIGDKIKEKPFFYLKYDLMKVALLNLINLFLILNQIIKKNR